MKKRAAAVLTFIITACFCCACGSESTAGSGLQEVSEDSRLIVYTSHREEVYRPIIREFEERYGVFVEVKSGGTNEMLEEIRGGTGAACDVMFGGGVETLYANEALFDSVELLSSLPMVIVYNDKLVYSESAPKGYGALLENRWKGKIAFADPCKSGSSYTALMTMLQLLPGGEIDTLSAFAEAVGGEVLQSSGDVATTVSAGTKLVGITLLEAAEKSIAAGSDLTIVYPEEGTSDVPDGVAIVKDCSHRKNAELFVDFVTGGDVQQYIVDNLYRRSVKEEITPSVTFSAQYPQKIKGTLNIADYDIEYASRNQDRILALWSDLIAR